MSGRAAAQAELHIDAAEVVAATPPDIGLTTESGLVAAAAHHSAHGHGGNAAGFGRGENSCTAVRVSRSVGSVWACALDHLTNVLSRYYDLH